MEVNCDVFSLFFKTYDNLISNYYTGFMVKEYELIPLFEQLIKQFKTGKKLRADGKRVTQGTIVNYQHTLKLLIKYQNKKGETLMVKELQGSNRREFQQLKKYYHNFYVHFQDYLFKELNYLDNTVGSAIKIIRVFFNWLNRSKGIFTGDFFKDFYVKKDEIPIIALSVEQLKFLIFNKEFEVSLSPPLLRTKDAFIIGCTCGLRFSDLLALKKTNLEQRDGHTYLTSKSKKTGKEIMVKLPDYAMAILKKYNRTQRTLLPTISLYRFNANIKSIARLAGWQHPIIKEREQNGRVKAITKRKKDGKPLLFCDQLSSHTMRRTAITSYLMLGMPEHFVRKVSGHTNNSKEFYRYVAFAQNIMDSEIEKVHDKIKT